MIDLAALSPAEREERLRRSVGPNYVKAEPPLIAAERAEIERLVAQGLSYKAIGRYLDRDAKTVRKHAMRVGLRSAHKSFVEQGR